MAEDSQLKEELAGTTAVVTVIKDNVLYCVSVVFIYLFFLAGKKSRAYLYGDNFIFVVK